VGIYRHSNFLIIECELGTAKVEVTNFAHILLEAWDRKVQLAKERNLELLEERGGHPKEKNFQVITNTFKPKPAKVRKGDVGKRWGAQLVHLKERKIGGKGNLECFQPRQECQPFEKIVGVAVDNKLKRECHDAHGSGK